MPDANIEFGAGIELPVTPPVIATATPPAPDSFLNELGTLFQGLPDGLTRESYADHVLSLQTQADEAESLRSQLAELKAQRLADAAEVAGKPAPSLAPVPPAATQEPEYELPWKPVKVDAAFRALVEPDPTGYGFAPKDKTSSIHIAAANEMNRRVQYENRFSQDLMDDPEGVVSKLTHRQITRMEASFKAQLDELRSQFQPIQETVAQTKAEKAQDAFLAANAAALYDDKGAISLVGQLTDDFMQDGLPIEKAFAAAQKAATRLNPAPPVTPVAPAATPAKISLSKVANPPVRTVDKINSRFQSGGKAPPERSPYMETPKFRKTFDDVEQEVRQQFGA